MSVLHMLRSEPDEQVRMLIAGVSEGMAIKAVVLLAGEVDYDRLVADIFDSDRVISWW